MAQQSDTVGLPKRLPLVTEAANRDSSTGKDARMVNCYAERTGEQEYAIYKRPGLLESATYSESAATGRGMYNWRGNIYTIFADTLYKDGTSIGTVSNAGFYAFSECLGATPKLFLDNLTTAYTWDNTTLFTIVDAQFPSNRILGSAYLDATTYVGTTAAVLWASDLDDPQAWDGLNFLTARIEPDRGVAVAKQLVYVIFFKEWTTEVFYDAENASGSPLGPVQGAKVGWGCASARSVQCIDDTLLWLATTRSAQAQVIMMANLKAEVVSTPAIERLLDNVVFTNVYSWTLKDEGHTFYVLTSVEANVTLAFDIRERRWSQWTDASGNYLPIIASAATSSNTHLVQHVSNGKVYVMDRTYTNDNGSIITVDLYTPNWDGGLDRRKHLNALRVLADRQQGSLLQVRHNDYDYDPAKWTRYRTLDLGHARPVLTNLGSFRRRAHNFRHQSDTALRMQAVDLQLDIGTL